MTEFIKYYFGGLIFIGVFLYGFTQAFMGCKELRKNQGLTIEHPSVKGAINAMFMCLFLAVLILYACVNHYQTCLSLSRLTNENIERFIHLSSWDLKEQYKKYSIGDKQ